MNWTKPYLGVSHLSIAGKKSRASISELGYGTTRTEVSLWFPGCGFSPINELHDSPEAAKARAEQWMKEAA